MRASQLVGCGLLLGTTWLAGCGDTPAALDPSGSGHGQTGARCDRNRASGELTGTVNVDGSSRSYLAHVPARADVATLPVVLAFHGSGGNAKGFKSQLKFEQTSGEDAIVVYLDGAADLDTQGDANADIRYVDAVLADVRKNHCVSDAFAIGYSRGAYFVNHLACYRGEQLTAIASHSGGGPYSAPWQNGEMLCPSSKPVAVLVMHGTDDPTVALSEGDKTIAYWSKRLACGAGQSPLAAQPPCVEQDGRSEPLQICKVDGIGHGMWDKSVATSWRFFSQPRR